MAPTSKLAAFLALAAASPHCDAFSFTPSPQLQQRQASVQLSASKQDENAMVDGLKRVSGGAAAFLTGMGIMAQVAMADPSAMAAVDESSVMQTQSSMVSSDVLLSTGAPSFGGGSTFDTLDFSLPSYDQATASGDATRSSTAPSAAPSSDSDDGDAAAKAAAKEDAKRAAEEEKAAQKQADADAREAKKQADADAKEAAAKEADAKVAAQEAKVKAKAERLAAEKEKQRIAVENQMAVNEVKETPPAAAAPPKVVIPAPPKVDAPKPAASEIKIPDMPKFEAPNMDAIKMPDMKAFSLPKVDIPAMPKIDIPALPKIDTPKFDMPAAPAKFDMPSAPAAPAKFDVPSAPAAPSVDENLEPQEVRDARAAETNAAYKDAQAEVKEAEKAASIAQNKAQAAKKVFKQAKGEACVTRPGGKALCLRGFGVGY